MRFSCFGEGQRRAFLKILMLNSAWRLPRGSWADGLSFRHVVEVINPCSFYPAEFRCISAQHFVTLAFPQGHPRHIKERLGDRVAGTSTSTHCLGPRRVGQDVRFIVWRKTGTRLCSVFGLWGNCGRTVWAGNGEDVFVKFLKELLLTFAICTRSFVGPVQVRTCAWKLDVLFAAFWMYE